MDEEKKILTSVIQFYFVLVFPAYRKLAYTHYLQVSFARGLEGNLCFTAYPFLALACGLWLAKRGIFTPSCLPASFWDSFLPLHLPQVSQCHRKLRKLGALCVEVGFYADISWESRCNIEINVWAHFYEILLLFEVPYWPWVKGMPGKS